ncbi:MAG: hypothetical protein ACI8UO_004721 [Verrucomicrobiales bacterium]|jgi:hypothetical protein
MNPKTSLFSKIAALIVGLAGFGLFTSSVQAETWIGTTGDLQFNFDRDADRILLYFKTDEGTFQIARGEITFDNGTALRGSFIGNDITEVGINKSRGIIYVLYNNPNTGKAEDGGTFAKTRVKVVD